MDKDYLTRRAQELGLDRGPALEAIQAALEAKYPGQVRAAALNRGVLKLLTPNASVASDLRLNQVDLLDRFRYLAQGQEITKLQILVRTI
jgi:hypothetical protein